MEMLSFGEWRMWEGNVVKYKYIWLKEHVGVSGQIPRYVDKVVFKIYQKKEWIS